MKKRNEYSYLSLNELQTIFLMRERKKSLQEIKRIINGANGKRSKSSISNAINKYCHPEFRTWVAMSGLEKAKYVYDQKVAHLLGKKRFGHIKDYETRERVYQDLINGYSPEQIAAKIKRELLGKSICFKTIYNYIKHNDPELKQYLYEKGKKRRKRVMDRRGRFKQGVPDKRSIHDREESVNNRERLCDWEGDTIVSCKGGNGAILSLVNRKTREKYARKVPDLKSDSIFAYLMAFLIIHPDTKTLTLDNGVEFAYSKLIELKRKFLGLKIYYCDPYKSYQKGSVERSNRDIRKYFPKGTNFSQVTQAEVINAQNLLNLMPLKCHGFLSPIEVKVRELALAA